MSTSLPRRSPYLDCGGVGDDGGDDGDSMRNIKTCLYAYLFTKFLRISFKYADVGLPMAEY